MADKMIMPNLVTDPYVLKLAIFLENLVIQLITRCRLKMKYTILNP